MHDESKTPHIVTIPYVSLTPPAFVFDLCFLLQVAGIERLSTAGRLYLYPCDELAHAYKTSC